VIIKEAPNIDIRGFLTLCGERVLFATPPLTPPKIFQICQPEEFEGSQDLGAVNLHHRLHSN